MRIHDCLRAAISLCPLLSAYWQGVRTPILRVGENPNSGFAWSSNFVAETVWPTSAAVKSGDVRGEAERSNT